MFSANQSKPATAAWRLWHRGAGCERRLIKPVEHTACLAHHASVEEACHQTHKLVSYQPVSSGRCDRTFLEYDCTAHDLSLFKLAQTCWGIALRASPGDLPSFIGKKLISNTSYDNLQVGHRVL